MVVASLLQEASRRLAARPTPGLDAELILGYVLRIGREQLFCSIEREVDERDVEAFFRHIDEVRDGKSVSYVTHAREFYGHDFYVDERVLVPRPETEMLVEHVIKRVNTDDFDDCRILDLGTGSGAIGISLALALPSSSVTLSDVSSDALEVAKINVGRLGLDGKVTIVESDLLSKFVDQHFDIIVANLPYIGEKKYRFISADVERHEPHVALFGGEDGLQLYKKMFQQLSLLKCLPKFILGEFGFAQSDDVRVMLNTFFEHQGADIQIFSDLGRIDRVFVVSFQAFSYTALRHG